MTPPATNFWRIAGMSYLQYVNRAAGSVRSALKEPMKSKLSAQGEFSYKASAWVDGTQMSKTEITSLSQAGK
ncbi:hypothetical protein FRACYDRAFT_271807 [Fragilariopsis cylindrus CCMP1102]|uniref:Uncharacterized protein n=1 Tax=Fragilariopsis cylindrus CCMP1102 TaxID=635003 RepID=A0A1E7ER17_9STRA|nr:hypothetical protein FRACYDRAFT_271807 [Fragilariopsis cylindrus CCMP1102]|eukprot:OEU08345.1 hypothetical protein FRACYDRAFT_271807 [Fragilariopsis cylindrus CCMP1102]